MTLIVEDGTGLADANVYATRAEFLAYHAERGNAAAASAEVEAVDAALIRATEFLDASYQWRGYAALSTQALSWPRRRTCEGASIGGVLNGYGYLMDRNGRYLDGLPRDVKRATMELALLGISTTYANGFIGGAAGGSVTAQGAQKRVKAGSVEVEWFGVAGGATMRQAMDSGLLPNGAGEFIDRLLLGLFVPANASRVRVAKS